MDGECGQHCPLQPVACSTHPRAWGACITAPTSLHTHSVPRGVGICSHLGFGSEFRHGCRAKATSGEHSPKQCWGCRGGCHGTHRHGAPQAVGCCKALLQLSVWCCYLGSSCSFGLFFFFPANAAALLLLSCHAPGQTNMHAGRHACTCVCVPSVQPDLCSMPTTQGSSTAPTIPSAAAHRFALRRLALMPGG